jgi:hypothetical protein
LDSEDAIAVKGDVGLSILGHVSRRLPMTEEKSYGGLFYAKYTEIARHLPKPRYEISLGTLWTKFVY